MKREAFMLPFARCARTIFPVVLKKKSYLSAVNCCCYASIFCSYCTRLKYCLNFKVKEACVPIGQKLPFNIWPINSYLHEKIKASPLYYFDKVKNIVIVRLDKTDYGDFFV